MNPAPSKWIANRTGMRIRNRKKWMSMDSIEKIGKTVGAIGRERGGAPGSHSVRRRDPRAAP